MSTEHEAGSRTGIKELHWRCWDCGELGRLEATALPEECPNCGAPKEGLYYWQQNRAGPDDGGRGTDPGRTTGGAPVGTPGDRFATADGRRTFPRSSLPAQPHSLP